MNQLPLRSHLNLELVDNIDDLNSKKGLNAVKVI